MLIVVFIMAFYHISIPFILPFLQEYLARELSKKRKGRAKCPSLSMHLVERRASPPGMTRDARRSIGS